MAKKTSQNNIVFFAIYFAMWNFNRQATTYILNVLVSITKIYSFKYILNRECLLNSCDCPPWSGWADMPLWLSDNRRYSITVFRKHFIKPGPHLFRVLMVWKRTLLYTIHNTHPNPLQLGGNQSLHYCCNWALSQILVLVKYLQYAETSAQRSCDSICISVFIFR